MSDKPYFRDEQERSDFLIALPVIAFFGCMLYYFLVIDGKQNLPPMAAINTGSAVTSDLDNDQVVDSEDHCVTDPGSVNNFGCPEDSAGDSAQDSGERSSQVTVSSNRSADSVNPETNKPRPSVPTAAVLTAPVLQDTDATTALKTDAQIINCQNAADEGCTDEPLTELTTPDKTDNEPHAEDSSSDRDMDGVLDDQDLCPDIAGSLANRGCIADSDSDGVSDEVDVCPSQSGLPENLGCPSDSDADGIPDDADACPIEKGSAENQGCPVTVPSEGDVQAVNDAALNISFPANATVLSGTAKNQLENVVALLKRYPPVKLSIEGHTDSVGDDAVNLQLSAARARACADYIVSRGIKPERVRWEGIGERQPVADNNTAEGREKNRRVELKLNL